MSRVLSPSLVSVLLAANALCFRATLTGPCTLTEGRHLASVRVVSPCGRELGLVVDVTTGERLDRGAHFARLGELVGILRAAPAGALLASVKAGPRGLEGPGWAVDAALAGVAPTLYLPTSNHLTLPEQELSHAEPCPQDLLDPRAHPGEP